MNKKQNIRIVDIAKMAKVSVGTVDRVLHNRGRVSNEKRKQVEEVLKEIDYEPNMVARFLASKKNYSFAVVIPSYKVGEYWELVRSGVEKAAIELKDFHVNINYLFFDQSDSASFQKICDELGESDYEGAVIATLYKEKVVNLSTQLDSKGIPYVFIDSNIPHCNNISYYGADSYVSGAIAAKLMLTKVGNDGLIVIVYTDYKQDVIFTQIESREKGFLNYLKEHKFKGKISYLSFNQSERDKGVEQLREILSEKSKVGAITFNSRIYEVASLVETTRADASNISLIGYDSIARNAEALESNKIAYLISQRSIQQGYESIKALSNQLIFNHPPEKNNYMAIDILIKENVSYYND